MTAKRNKIRQLKTPLKKHNNLASLLMEIMPEEYKQIKGKELAQGIITEDSLEAIYGDGMRQVESWISSHRLYLKSEKRTVLKGFKESGHVDVIGQKDIAEDSESNNFVTDEKENELPKQGTSRSK